MLTETGTVTRIEHDALWVDTVQRTTCASCVARKGCGQRVLARLTGRTASLRVLLGGRSPDTFRLHQEVIIGVPEAVVVNGSLGVYLVPLVTLLGGGMLASSHGAGEALTALAALAGLFAGGGVVRWFSWRKRNDPRFQPVLLDDSGIPFTDRPPQQIVNP